MKKQTRMATVDLNKKRYRKFLNKGNEEAWKADAGKVATNTVEWSYHRDLLERCRRIYEKGQYLRDQMRRCTNYTQGRQWEDWIDDPDSPFHQKIKEKDYIKRQGLVPLKYNIIKKSMKSTCGIFANNMQPPRVGVRGDDKRGIGDMATCALISACQQNNVPQYLTSTLEDAWQKGVFLLRVGYSYNHESKMSDVSVQNEDYYKLIIDNNLFDKQMRDLSIIGMIRDMSFNELCYQFAEGVAQVQALSAEYNKNPYNYADARYAFENESMYGKNADSFFEGPDPSLCRVYEIWTLEYETALYCHDTAVPEEYFRPLSDQDAVDQENANRIAQALADGVEPMLIINKPMQRKFWYVRYLTPTGLCIREQETPYAHNSHPFVFGAFPMVDGEVHSPAEEIIDVQRALNRTLSQIDFIRQRGAKNMLMVDVNTIPEHMSWDDFADEYSRNGSMMFVKLKPGAQMPQQLKSTPVQEGDIAMANMLINFADQMSGVNGALRGEKAASDTPASLYAQQAENSANNIAYFMQWFWGCANELYWKMVQLQQQYYDEGRYLPLAGNKFAEEAHIYRAMDAKSVQLYLEIQDAQSVAFFKANFERTLTMALQTQAIDFLTYLKSTNAPFAPKLAEELERRQAMLAQMQGTAVQ